MTAIAHRLYSKEVSLPSQEKFRRFQSLVMVNSASEPRLSNQVWQAINLVSENSLSVRFADRDGFNLILSTRDDPTIIYGSKTGRP